MRAAALFSGGKDSLYATYLVEKQGVVIDDLITLLPTLPRPSPHAENIGALKVLAQSMHKNLTIIDFRKEGAFIQTWETLKSTAWLPETSSFKLTSRVLRMSAANSD
jgi:diphthamide synthase (EF-2-diphthine--ammonia ligase)